MLNKQIIILNGSGTSGKGTFVKILNKYIPTMEYSIVNKPKDVVRYAGIPNQGKTEELRKVWSDVKLYLERWDIPYKDVQKYVDYYNKSRHFKLMSIDMREKHDIDRFVKEYGAIKVLVINNMTI